MFDKISIHKIQVFAYHGVFPEEKKLGQKFVISVDLMADLSKVCQSDLIEDGICYGEITERIVLFCQNNRFNTLEALGHKLGENLLFLNKVIESVTIKIEKPNAPIKYLVDHVAVSVTRTRYDYRQFPDKHSVKEKVEIDQDA